MSLSQQESLDWERLVTDGHVRAARIRKAQPWIVALAIILTLIGWGAMSSISGYEGVNDRETTLSGEVEKRRLEAQRAFAGLPPPSVDEQDKTSIMLASELPALQSDILTGLKQDDEIPSNAHVKIVDDEEFWRTPWNPNEVVGATGSSVRIVGAVINSGDAEFPNIGRWLAVFRKKDGEWDVVTIDYDGFVSVPDTASTQIDKIPVTLSPILDTGD